MEEDIKHSIVKLRTCVAFLGEKEQLNWWPSSFLSSSGEGFLRHVFPKTATLSRINGASAAACVSHDYYIGTGSVYHLFRLPENIEYGISQTLVKDDSVLKYVDSQDAAKTCLHGLANEDITSGVGPLLIELARINAQMISQMAAAYLKGFNEGSQVYPYYRSKV